MPTTTTTHTHNALQVLKNDHRRVEDLFAQFEQLGPKAYKGRQTIVTKVIEELSVHAAIEEMVFYPAARQVLEKGDGDLVLEALEEHHVVKWTLTELDGMSSHDERYAAKMTVLMEMVRHHVKEEENDLFPKVKSAMTRTELDELGDALMAAKEGVPTRPHPHAPDTPPGNILSAAVSIPLDAARSAGEAAVKKVRKLGSR
jgi:hemerythrin superfamily protein